MFLRCPSCLYAKSVKKENKRGQICENCNFDLDRYYFSHRTEKQAEDFIYIEGMRLKTLKNQKYKLESDLRREREIERNKSEIKAYYSTMEHNHKEYLKPQRNGLGVGSLIHSFLLWLAERTRTLLGWVIPVTVGVFFVYPLVMEEEVDWCPAVEKKAWEILEKQNEDLRFVKALVTETGYYRSGTIAKSYASNEFPKLPAFLGCNLLYWNVLMDKENLQKSIANINESDLENLFIDSVSSSPELMRLLMDF